MEGASLSSADPAHILGRVSTRFQGSGGFSGELNALGALRSATRSSGTTSRSGSSGKRERRSTVSTPSPLRTEGDVDEFGVPPRTEMHLHSPLVMLFPIMDKRKARMR
ncbi:hypothetical protein NMY22_g11148 [Coprinellus aureogranulatus]|nr:hypothetical protein NMY22_g11148 [Coprinellus aureogranulatus]